MINYVSNFIVSALCILLITPTYSNAGQFKLESTPDLGVMKHFKASALCQVADNTKAYMQQNPNDTFGVHAGTKINTTFTLAQVKKSLAFICNTYRDDVRNQRHSRLHDVDFLHEHFDFYRWYPDTQTADEIAEKSTNSVKTRLLKSIPSEQIFLTKYYTKLLKGSRKQTPEYSQALYALPYDEKGKSKIEAEKIKNSLTRFRYTRQQVINGALRGELLAKPLIWLSEPALHDVLLQGTGVLQVGSERHYYNVHRNNGIAYNYAIGKSKQSRYWYFAKVPSILGYGTELENKIAVEPQVTFAGNVADLGLGKLILLNYQQGSQSISRMGILADQGGAFDNNFFQLDMLVGSYYGWTDYHKANKHVPDYANAWVLILK